jgi:hypothetical protein
LLYVFSPLVFVSLLSLIFFLKFSAAHHTGIRERERERASSCTCLMHEMLTEICFLASLSLPFDELKLIVFIIKIFAAALVRCISLSVCHFVRDTLGVSLRDASFNNNRAKLIQFDKLRN